MDVARHRPPGRSVDRAVGHSTAILSDNGCFTQIMLQPDDNPFGSRLSPISQEQAVTHLSGSDRPIMVPGEGFEPPTFGLQNRCTTTVLTRRPAPP